MPQEPVENKLDLSKKELAKAEQRAALSAVVVHEAIRLEGEQELQRSSTALFWSGLAAGLSMGFSLVTEGLLRSRIPDVPWRPIITKLGYSVGFVLVVMGRQQLFTENTLTPILPLMLHKSRAMLRNVLRLWGLVLLANLIGAVAIAWVLGNSGVFRPEVRRAFEEIGREALSVSFGLALLRGIFAGWLIAFMVWLLPFSEAFRILVIVGITWLVGLAQLTHVIAGSIEVLYLAVTGVAPVARVVFGYIAPTLIGNIVGGVALVAALNHAQVVSK